jgi:hypothetical protein
MWIFETVRGLATATFIFITLAIITGLISANVRFFASKRGLDTYLDKLANHPRIVSAIRAVIDGFNRMIAGWAPLKKRWWLWLALGLSGGLAAALWAPLLDARLATPPPISAIVQTHPITTEVPNVATASIDVPTKIKTIDELLEILDSEWDPWMNTVKQFSTWRWRRTKEDIHAYRSDIYKMYGTYMQILQKIAALNKRNEKFPDIFALTTQSYTDAFTPKIVRFQQVFGGLSDPMANALDQATLENAFQPYATELYEQAQRADDWRQLTSRKALEIRKSLSR